jgi:glycosyltransferase involved in cell wall biosynthesis
MGGTGLYVHALARALEELGHEVELLGPESAGAEPPRRWEQTWAPASAPARLRAWLVARRPEVLHIHHLDRLGLGLPGLARGLGIRVVMTLHDYALPCARGQLLNVEHQACAGPEVERCARCLALPLRLNPLAARAGRLPWLRGAALGLAPRPRPQDEARVRERDRAAREAIRAVEVLLSPSEDLARRVEAWCGRRAQACELPLIAPIRPAGPRAPGPMRFLFASALIPAKGPQRLIRLWPRLRVTGAVLRLVGPRRPADEPPWLTELLRSLPEGVELRPEVAPEGMPGLLEEHDALVLPSIWPENSPLVLREALAAGLPVIIPSLGGAAELCPGATRVGPQDEEGLHAALMAEIARGPRRLSPRGWSTALEHARWLDREAYALRAERAL